MKIFRKRVKARLYDDYLYLYKSPIVFMGFSRWQWSRIRNGVVT